jgi:hypothetical protein
VAHYNINKAVLEAARGSDFEPMMWYAYYVLTENETEDLRSAYKEQITEIVKAAAFHGYDKMKIDDLTVPAYIFIIDRIHKTYAPGFLDFEAVCTSFALFLQFLVDHKLIKANSFARIMKRPEFYSNYKD